MSDASTLTGFRPLYWLAVGTFAVGTEGFMIAGLLPGMASDLGVGIATAGQLVTAFALAYAISSPVLTALTGSMGRRRLLIIAMTVFALANGLAAMATSYWALMGARLLLAFSAGLYVPGANALAGAVARPEERGKALSIVNGGLSIAVAFGVPIGAVVGERLGWRMTFIGVLVLSLIALAGLVLRFPRHIGIGLPNPGLRERLRAARQPVVLMTLLTTTLWAAGSYTVYTYLSPFVSNATSLHNESVSIVLFAWGVAAAIGVALSGRYTDRFGFRAVIVPCLSISILSFLLLSSSAYWLSKTVALVPVVIAVVTWGATHWGFYPAQQASLIHHAGRGAAPIVLSLNASFMYLGFSLGSALGAVVMTWHSTADLGWAAALCELAAVSMTLLVGAYSGRQQSRSQAVELH